jgi:hypothetical protein
VPSTSLSIVGARTGVVDNGDGRRVAGGIVEAAGGGAAGNGEGGPAPGSGQRRGSSKELKTTDCRIQLCTE